MFCGRTDVTKFENQERAQWRVVMDNNSLYVDRLKRGNFLTLSAYIIKNLAMEIITKVCMCHDLKNVHFWLIY